MEIQSWLESIHQALLSEGFVDPGLFQQVVKPGQVFGVVKCLDDVWEMHVRGFADGILEAEIEVSREYLEHFNDKYRTDASTELIEILDWYGIPYHVTGTLPQMVVRLEIPEKVTPWRPLAAVAGILALLWLFDRGWEGGGR